MGWLIWHFSFTYYLWRNYESLWLVLNSCFIANSTAIIIIQDSERTNGCRLRKSSHKFGSKLFLFNFFFNNLVLQSVNVYWLSWNSKILCSFWETLASTRVLSSSFRLWIRRSVFWFLSKYLKLCFGRNLVLSLLLEHIITVGSLMFWSF